MTKQSEHSKKKFSIPVGTLLLYLAAGFQATQFARAFHEIDPSSKWSDIGGTLAGIVVNVSLAYSVSRLPRIRSKKQQQFAYAAFWALVIMTPIFLAPINFKTMGGLWSELWPVKLALAVISASVVDAAIALVALSDGSLFSLGAQSEQPALQSDAGAMQSAKSANAVRRSAKQSAKSATDSDALRRTYPRKCEHCEVMIHTPQSVGAHMKKHHPELCKPKVLAENLFENVKVSP